MLARRKAKLPFYLNALREKEYAEKYPGCLLNNFHNLLRFWQRHYLNKDKDSTCLENVSSSHSFLYPVKTSVNTVILTKDYNSCMVCVTSQYLLLTFSHFAATPSKHSDRELTCMHTVKTKTLSAALQ